MLPSKQLTELFFHDLKTYNSTNFKTLYIADLDQAKLSVDATTYKAFSSVMTRYFIFCERRPELTLEEKRLLFFKLKIDMIAKYFMDFPDGNIDLLKAFQLELQNYIETKDVGANESTLAI